MPHAPRIRLFPKIAVAAVTAILLAAGPAYAAGPAGFGMADISDPMNLDCDPSSRILTSFAKGRGLGDCCDETQWVWDGKAFRVLLSRVMGECRGVPFDDWPTLFQGEVR